MPNDRPRLEALSREIEAKYPGTLTRVAEPEGRDRPWVVHVFNVEPGKLASVNAGVASALVDLMAESPALDAIGMAHTIDATAKHYAGCVAEAQLIRCLDRGAQAQTTLGVWYGNIVVGESVRHELSGLSCENDVQWLDLMGTLNAPVESYAMRARVRVEEVRSDESTRDRLAEAA